MKIDHRKRYIAVLDTETVNGLDDPLVYDIGWAMTDKYGNVYLARSYLISDIFCDERELMKSAYYAEKIPNYLEDIRNGKRKIISFRAARRIFAQDCKRYNCNTVSAHNARFDNNALNVTQRFLTGSKYRFFFPYGFEIWDTMKMAQDVICPMPTYKKFCAEHEGFTLADGRPRKTAEILYRFIIKNPNFVESHTALEDVMIEKDILAYCFRQHKKMRKGLWQKEFSKKKIPISEEERINQYIKEIWGE